MAAKNVQNPRKVQMRRDIEAKLVALSAEEKIRQSNIIVAKILQHPKYKTAKRISLFLSLPTEVDTAPILDDMLSRGVVPFIPQYFRGGMRMLRVLPGDVDTMPHTSWGIKQHAREVVREDAMVAGLDLVIAPGAAFTVTGWRLGHGGGYYDRYLAQLLAQHQANPGTFPKPYILAVGFREQICEEIPVDAQDVKVDEVVTAE